MFIERGVGGREGGRRDSELLVPAGEFVGGDGLVPGVFVEVGGVSRALDLGQDGRSQAPCLQTVPVKTLKTTRYTISLSLSLRSRDLI